MADIKYSGLSISSKLLIAGLIEQGYQEYPLGEKCLGCLLAEPEVLRNPDDQAKTIPQASLYAMRGDLVVLRKPLRIDNRGERPTPDGFLNNPDEPIEFKHPDSNSSNAFTKNLSKASKGLAHIRRSVWLAEGSSLRRVAEILHGHYKISPTMNKVDIIVGQKIIEFDRDFWTLHGLSGLKAKLGI